MKLIRNIFTIIIVLILVLFLGRNFIIKFGAEIGVKAATGLPLKIGKFSAGLFQTNVDVDDFRLMNPKGYQEKVMLDVPDVFVDYKVAPLLKGTVHLEEVRFHLREFVVVKNADGTSNLDALTALQESQKAKTSEKEEKSDKPAKKTNVKIDNLSLKIDKVKFIEYDENGDAKVKEFNIGLDETHSDIKSLETVVSLIVFKALFKTPIALANIDIGDIGGALGGTLSKTTETATKLLGEGTGTITDASQKVGGAVGDATNKLKGLFGN